MIGPFRPEPNGRPVVQPEPPLFLCFCGTFKPARRQIRSTRLWFTCQPAFFRKPATIIAITAILTGQFNDIDGQPFDVIPALRNLSLYRAAPPQGPALRHAKLGPHMFGATTTTRTAQTFPLSASVNMSLSNVK